MSIPPVPDQDLQLLSWNKERERMVTKQDSGFPVELSLVGRHLPSSTVRQQPLTNQTASILQNQGTGTNARGRTATQGKSPSDESENSTSHSAASKAPRAFASTYEKAATPRQPPL